MTNAPTGGGYDLIAFNGPHIHLFVDTMALLSRFSRFHALGHVAHHRWNDVKISIDSGRDQHMPYHRSGIRSIMEMEEIAMMSQERTATWNHLQYQRRKITAVPNSQQGLYLL